MRNVALLLSLCSFLVSVAVAEPPVCPRKTESPKRSRQEQQAHLLEQIKERIPPLKHKRGDRWPMIMWEGVGYDPQPPEVYQALLARGLTQPIRMNEKMLASAQALQKAGAPVVIMEGAGGPWPSRLAGKPEKWQHQFEEGFTLPKGKRARSCPALYEGWSINADRVRKLLREWKEAGVTVDAVWTDWEGDPMVYQWDQIRHCRRCRELMPGWALKSGGNCFHYTWRLYLGMLDAYLAAPVLEVYPTCSVTNWMVCFSTPDRPVIYWNNGRIPPSMPLLMNATNPVAYGNTVFWQFWNEKWPLEREHVDTFYTHLLLRMVSANEANLRRFAPATESIPWVSRWCPDVMDAKIPIISRPRYREVLRHIWLRGADGMQIFNPPRRGYDEVVFAEVADAVTVYDEMLAFRDYLNGGEPMNLEIPGVQHDGVLWSGLRLEDRAVVRAIKQGGGEAKLALQPWSEKRVELDVTGNGRTWLLTLHDGKVTAELQSSEM